MASAAGEARASLTVDSELPELSRVSAWVQDWAERQHLPPRVTHSLDLCSTEVVTNIVNHGCANGAHRILLRLGREGEEVTLDVEDEGREFDPRLVPEPARPASIQDARVGGWGIPIVRRFSDGLRWRHEGGRNCLTLVFHAAAQ